MSERILLVDDEQDIADLLEEVLKKDGFTEIRKVYNGLDAIEACRNDMPDMVILDVMLPDLEGTAVCRKIREFSIVPILFLSSKNDDVDKIMGLAAGGDDYVTKPFSPKEIVYRVKSQLRRQQYLKEAAVLPGKSLLCAGAITVDTEACCAYKNGTLLELTAKEYCLLQYLLENSNKIISKERLYEHVWGEEAVVCDNTIMVHIRHLREKIEDNPSEPHYLITVKGLGYKLKRGK